MLDVLPQYPGSHSGGELGGAAIEHVDRALSGGTLSHVAPFLQSSLHGKRKQDCAQAPQNLLLMKSIGDQVKDFRNSQTPVLLPGELAKKIGGKVRRQHIEQLEAAGNRIPKYLGDLAAVMGTTADEMLATAGLAKPARRMPASAPPGAPKGAVFHAPTPEEMEFLDHWRRLLKRDREKYRLEIEELARVRAAEIQEYMSEHGITAIAQRAASEARRARENTSVDVNDELKQRSLLDEPDKS